MWLYVDSERLRFCVCVVLVCGQYDAVLAHGEVRTHPNYRTYITMHTPI